MFSIHNNEHKISTENKLLLWCQPLVLEDGFIDNDDSKLF